VKSGKDVFQSKSVRDYISKHAQKEAANLPAPGQYDRQDGFDIKYNDLDGHQLTHQF
jgi:hypothetical protein